MNGVYLYFVNKHLSSWPLLGLLTNDYIFDSLKFEGVIRREFICYSNAKRSVLKKSRSIVGTGENVGFVVFFFFFGNVLKCLFLLVANLKNPLS